MLDLFKSVFSDENFRELFKKMLLNYLEFISFNKNIDYIEHKKLLRISEIFSFSEDENLQNLAQQIAILLCELFPDNEFVKATKEAVYRNVSNFASLSLLEKNKTKSKFENEFLTQVRFLAHKIHNQMPNSQDSFFNAQLDIFNTLKTETFYSFSAPTSMGKTFVITKFIQSKIQENSDENFVILVPTKALLGEIAKKLILDLEEISKKHKVITVLSNANKQEKFIAVLTPERLYYAMLKEPKNIVFTYLFVDEAHKISVKDSRSVVYYKLLDMVKKFENDIKVVFSAPVIPNPEVYLQLTKYDNPIFEKNKSKAFKFSPVVQNKILIKGTKLSIFNPISKSFEQSNIETDSDDKNKILDKFGNNKLNLIYLNSKDKAINHAVEFARNMPKIQDEKLKEFAKYIRNKIHKDYYLADLVEKGVAFHIGGLPVQIRLTLENLIHEKIIKYCFCTSTLLEGVNVPVDNLFIFSHKNGKSNLADIDVFNLMGRAGRVSLNEFGNIFLVMDIDGEKHFEDILKKGIKEQKLLPKEALDDKTKKEIINALKKGETKIKKEDEYAYRCLNMLLGEILSGVEGFLVNEFSKVGLDEKTKNEIREKFKNEPKTDDIDISVLQRKSLCEEVKKGLRYPDNFDYQKCCEFLQNLSKIFDWEQHEKYTLGSEKYKYFATILLKWMNGKGVHEIIKSKLDYHKKKGIIHINRQKCKFDDSIEQRNTVINDTLNDIDQVISYKIPMYFLRLSEAILKIFGLVQNDWYEYAEYGTNNDKVIALQKHGFLREEALEISNDYGKFVSFVNGNLEILDKIFEQNISSILQEKLKIVKINYPEIFKQL